MVEYRMMSAPPEDENESFWLAQRYRYRYVDSLVDEYKTKKETVILTESIEIMASELREIREELTEIRQQNAVLVASVQYLDFTRLTLGVGGLGRTGFPPQDAKIDAFMARVLERGELGAQAAETEETALLRRDTGRLPRFNSEEFNSAFAPGEPPANDDLSDTITDKLLDKLSEKLAGLTPDMLAVKAAASQAVVTAETAIPAAAEAAPNAAAEEKPKNKMVSIISNICFYACMALLIIGAVTFAQSDDVDKSIFGVRYYYIKSASMEPVLPVGSVVFTRITPPEEIEVGDDITVYIGDGNADTYLTHRVVEITEDASGGLAFRTKGVNNRANDPTPFSADQLTGKVMFCIPVLGTIMTFVQSQLIFVIGIFVLLLALSFMLRLLFSKEPETDGKGAVAEAPSHKMSKRQLKQWQKQRQAELLAGIVTDRESGVAAAK